MKKSLGPAFFDFSPSTAIAGEIYGNIQEETSKETLGR